MTVFRCRPLTRFLRFSSLLFLTSPLLLSFQADAACAATQASADVQESLDPPPTDDQPDTSTPDDNDPPPQPASDLTDAANSATQGLGQDVPASEASPRGVRLDQPVVKLWRVGFHLDSSGGACGNVTCTVPVPMEWPEQKVRIVEEDVTPLIGRAGYRVVEGGTQQLLVQIARLPAGRQEHAIVTMEVTTHTTLAPEETSVYKIPDRRQIPREFGRYLKQGSHIEVRHPLIRRAVAEAVDRDAEAWVQVRAIYDYVREKVEYREGPLKGAVQAIKDEYGDCESMTCLFVAMCRLNQVPARMVWVVDHAYPEFFLVDEHGVGHWFPCQVAGSEAFGCMPDARPILQKGEDFAVPGQRGRQHYVNEYLTGTPARGARQPQVEFIREYVGSVPATTVQP